MHRVLEVEILKLFDQRSVFLMYWIFNFEISKFWLYRINGNLGFVLFYGSQFLKNLPISKNQFLCLKIFSNWMILKNFDQITIKLHSGHFLKNLEISFFADMTPNPPPQTPVYCIFEKEILAECVILLVKKPMLCYWDPLPWGRSPQISRIWSCYYSNKDGKCWKKRLLKKM